jgi:hypothetical protein
MSDAVPARVIWSQDRQNRAMIVARREGGFQIFEEFHLYDSDTDVWYWTGFDGALMIERSGIYETADLAERDLRTVPRYEPGLGVTSI